MIKLSEKDYYLSGVSEDFFWEQLDGITAGQVMNPEFSYSTQYLAKFENVFGGRRVKNKFSIFLYRPIAKVFRCEILSKGTVEKTENGIHIHCRFELPFWSFLVFLVFSALMCIPAIVGPELGAGVILCAICVLLYFILVQFNQGNMKDELKKQLLLIQNKAKEDEVI